MIFDIYLLSNPVLTMLVASSRGGKIVVSSNVKQTLTRFALGFFCMEF